MAKKVKKAKKAQSQWYRIAPGYSKSFVYVGDLIPELISVKNAGAKPTEFRLTSKPAGWVSYGRVLGNRLIPLVVHFPDGQLTFHNDGPSTIEISGQFLRPT
jgi:hypothetical protein